MQRISELMGIGTVIHPPMTLTNGPQPDMPSHSQSDLSFTCEECGNIVNPILVEFPKGMGGPKYIRSRCQCQVKKSIEAVEKAKDFERKIRYERFFAYSTLGQRFLSKSFENYKVSPETHDAFTNSQRFVQNVLKAQSDEERALGLLLTGPVGTGKSHLAAAVFNKLKDIKTCVFVNVPELIDKIQASYHSDANEKEEDIINALKTCDVLILDDLGAEYHKNINNDWATQKLFTVIDNRYRHYRPLFITTNCLRDELETKIGSRIMSRLAEMCVFNFCGGKDHRLQSGNGRGA